MADLNHLLSMSADDIEEVLLPVGTWKCIAKKASLSDEKYSEKLEANFRQAVFVLTPTEPTDDVSAREVEKLGDSIHEITLFYRLGPIYRTSDVLRLRKVLSAMGVPSAGRTIEEMLSEVNGQEVFAEVETETYQEEERNAVKKIYAAD